MFKLEHTVAEFASALRQNMPVEIDEYGMWRIPRNPFKRWLCRTFPTRYLTRLADRLLSFFRELERRPVIHSKQHDAAWRQTQSFAQAARVLEWRLKEIPGEKAYEIRIALARCRIGMMYRHEPNQGGYAMEPPYYGLMRALTPEFEKWKRQSADDEEQETLKLISRYPLFAKLILKNDPLREKFFLWVFRDHNPAEVFIQYPNLTEALISCELSYRLGSVKRELLKIQYLPGPYGKEKHLTMLCEDKWASILNPQSEVLFRGGLRMTVDQIFRTFGNKYKQVGDLEVFLDGVVNWNTFKMGYRDGESGEIVMIDLLKEEWWNEVPVLEEVTRRELQMRYKTKVKKNQWFACAHATRGYLNLSYEGTHAFLEIAVPLSNNRWRLLNFGKYGLTFPSNAWEVLKFFTKVMPAGIMYPDENVYYTFRQHGFFPIAITKLEAEKLFELIRHHIFRGFAGHSVYQIESENCAKWTNELVTEVVGEERLPNLYRMSLLDTEPGGAMSKLFSLIKKFPRKIHAMAITRLHLPIGAWRGIWVSQKGNKQWVSLSNHRFWNTAEVYLPALLIKKREEGLFEIRAARLDNKTSWQESTRGTKKKR